MESGSGGRADIDFDISVRSDGVRPDKRAIKQLIGADELDVPRRNS